jgi:hypothetical protein
MTGTQRSSAWKSARLLLVIPMITGVGLLGFPQKASSVQVEHIVLEVQSALGLPGVQAGIAACLGEEVFFTGTVRITLTDGVATQFVWAGMTGVTLDGDVFSGGSGVTVGSQANLTLAETNAGPNARQFHIQIVGGNLITTVCHQ